MEILAAVDAVGVVEAARDHDVPQTTVSNWLHRDATKVAREQAAQKAAARGRSKLAKEAAERAGGLKVARKKAAQHAGGTKAIQRRRASTTAVSEETVGLRAPPAPTMAAAPPKVVAASPSTANEVAAPKVAAPKAAAKPTTVLPKPGTRLPNSLLKRVARSYTPSEKAEALEYAATHGVSAASEKLGMSRFSLYNWQRKLEKPPRVRCRRRRAVQRRKRSSTRAIARCVSPCLASRVT